MARNRIVRKKALPHPPISPAKVGKKNLGNKRVLRKQHLCHVVSFALSIWYGKLTCKDKNKMKKIVKTAGRLQAKTVSLDELYNRNVMKQVDKIMNDVNHPLNCHYTFLRSGRRLALPMQHTSRFKHSFIPKSIKLYNYLASR